MPITEVADECFTYDGRLASFQTSHALSRRRGSNASTKAPKSLKWPHKFLAPEELAKAGFFYHPTQASPDNTACFLCKKALDGWEKGDDPLVEHLKHSPECGWAIVATIEKQDGRLSQEHPLSARMIDARKSTFADKWPHESKKGWKCKVKQLVDAGWKYTPTPEYGDMATCTYCNLALDGWEKADKPLDEHVKRSQDCPFFTLINNDQQSPAAKRTKGKKDRASKVSRMSTQSVLTIASEAPSLEDLPAEEEDSILTTATNASAKKMGKAKKGTAGKGKKTKAKRDEATPVPEPEDDDYEVKVEAAPKATRGWKRKTEDIIETSAAAEIEEPPAKRRTTRTRASVASNDTILAQDESTIVGDASKLAAGGRKKGRLSTRKASAASVASRGLIPNDEELDAALEADLDSRLTDDEDKPDTSKKGSRSSKINKPDHAMFDLAPIVVDEAAIEAELEAMEVESKPLPKAKGGKGKQPRKVSAKQQAAMKKVAEAGAAAQRAAEEEVEASQQIMLELEQNISIQHSSPVIQPKRQRAPFRRPSQQGPGRAPGGSVLSVNESNVSMAGESVMDHGNDSGNETDASMASQSTIVRGDKERRGITMKNGKSGEKVASRNIEEIVNKCQTAASVDVNLVYASGEAAASHLAAGVSMEEAFFMPTPEAPSVAEQPTPKASTSIASKARGRPPKAAPAPIPVIEEPPREMELVVEDQVPASKSKPTKGKAVVPMPRSPTPQPREQTPSQSPQSSDAENHPPSSKPSNNSKKPSTPRSTKTRTPLATATPTMSPSKRNVIARLQSTQPWNAVNLDNIFLKSPSDGNGPIANLFGNASNKVNNGDLTTPEKKMTVEEWIHYNAVLAEEKLRSECERMVSSFESAGTRAMQALEGVDCIE